MPSCSMYSATIVHSDCTYGATIAIFLALSVRSPSTSAPALVTTGAGAPSRTVTSCSRCCDWQ